MNLSKTQHAIALAVALALGGAGIAHGQYNYTVGTAPGGGNTITGTGSPGALTTQPPLSATGGDFITIASGATVISLTPQDSIQLYTPNNTLVNNGLIFGPDGVNPGDTGFNAIYGDASSTTIINEVSIIGGAGANDTSYTQYGGLGGNGIYFSQIGLGNIAITNVGLISGGYGGAGGGGGGRGGEGGNGIALNVGFLYNITINNAGGLLVGGNGGQDYSYRGEGGEGGSGIDLQMDSGTNITITNSGTIAGGEGLGDNAYRRAGGEGGVALYIQATNLTTFNLVNSNQILGGVGGWSGRYENAGVGGSAILIQTGNMTGISVNNTNTGSITGGAGGIGEDTYSYSGGDGGDALNIQAANDIDTFTLVNSGNIFGGAGGSGGYDPGGGGDGGDALYLDSTNGNLNNIVIKNSGSILGGAAGSDTNDFSTGGAGGTGIYLSSGNNATGVTITNAGAISGGLGGSSGYQRPAGNGGDAIYVAPSTLSAFTLTNSGTISGGQGGSGGDDTVYPNYGGYGGNGVYLNPTTAVNNFLIVNTGLIAGGQDGTTGLDSYWSGEGGDGVYIDAASVNSGTLVNSGTIRGGNGSAVDPGTEYGGYGGAGIEVDVDSINGLTILNSGLILGGNGGNGGYDTGDGGDGIDLYGYPINHLTLINQGTITGGIGSNTDGGGYGGNGLYIATESDPLTNVYILNKGTISGGNSFEGYDGGNGVSIEAYGSSNSNVVVDNRGVIRGGNSDTGAAGIGVYLEANNVTVNNWGTIAAGAGTNPMAIYADGSNNIINLNGHSTVSGTISGLASSNNVLNLNFTGLTPAALAALKAQILAQGNLQNFTGTFTVRGVVYNVDPMVLNINATSYQLLAQTPNQAAIGRTLDGFTTNPVGDKLALLNAIDMSGNVPGALEELSPQKYEIYGEQAIANASAMTQNIDRRLNNLRDGSENIDTTGLGGDNTVAAVVTGDPSKDGSKDSKQVVQTAPEQNRWGFFATGDGIFFRGDSHNADLQDGKSNTAGTLLGVDGKVGDHGVIGAFGAYDDSAVALGNDGSHATIESYTGGLYGAYHQDGFYANGLGAYTRNNYTSDRNITLPGYSTDAGGSTHGNQYTANIDGGYDWHLTDRVTAGPLGGLQYTHLDVNSFGESGGAGALGIGSQNMNSLQSRLGGRIDYHLLTKANSSSAIELYAAWQHEYLDGSRAIGASFEGTGLAPFSVQTASPLRDAAVVGASLNFTFHNRLTLFADYELQMWQSSYFSQSINGGAKISF